MNWEMRVVRGWSNDWLVQALTGGFNPKSFYLRLTSPPRASRRLEHCDIVEVSNTGNKDS